MSSPWGERLKMQLCNIHIPQYEALIHLATMSTQICMCIYVLRELWCGDLQLLANG